MLKKKDDRLKMWQDRYTTSKAAWESQYSKFDNREQLYRGKLHINPAAQYDRERPAYLVRNCIHENIEAEVDTTLPMPKVRAVHPEDEEQAQVIEDMITEVLDKLPFERINDMMERMTYIQGGGFYFLEWDNSIKTHNTVGGLTVQAIHPKQFVPQDGIYELADMDYFFLKLSQTKAYIKKRYGIDLKDTSEEEPEARAINEPTANDLITQYVAYYKNSTGGIGKYSWVRDTVLEDLDDYQSRVFDYCPKCDKTIPAAQQEIPPTKDGKHPLGDGTELPQDFDGKVEEKPRQSNGEGKCPYCHGKLKQKAVKDEEILVPFTSTAGINVPGERPMQMTGSDGMPITVMVPTKVPYYVPNVFPLVAQKGVSVFGQLLGESDCDLMAPTQNAINRITAKIMDETISGGSYMILPDDADLDTSNDELKVFRINNPADKELFDTISMYPDAGEMNAQMYFRNQLYEETRQIIGITDSYLGRQDTTATSGKAKEFSAAQASSRFESKRIMKEAAYQEIYELIFKYMLAYADEPRPVKAKDHNGSTIYKTFDRFDFLKQDENGEWYWNTEFDFSVDPNTPLAKDREAMWQETRMNLQTGAYGDPASLDTLILFWRKMEELHYPGAAGTKQTLMEQMEKQQAMIQQQQMMQQQAMAMQEQQVETQAEADAVTKILKGGEKNGNATEKEKDGNISGEYRKTESPLTI